MPVDPPRTKPPGAVTASVSATEPSPTPACVVELCSATLDKVSLLRFPHDGSRRSRPCMRFVEELEPRTSVLHAFVNLELRPQS